MTDKEVRKLKRAELFEILFYMEKELEELRQENEELHRQLTEGAIPEADLERIASAVAEKLKGASVPAKECEELAETVKATDETTESAGE